MVGVLLLRYAQLAEPGPAGASLVNWMPVNVPFTELARKACQTTSNLSIWGHRILVHQRVKRDLFIMASMVGGGGNKRA